MNCVWVASYRWVLFSPVISEIGARPRYTRSWIAEEKERNGHGASNKCIFVIPITHTAYSTGCATCLCPLKRRDDEYVKYTEVVDRTLPTIAIVRTLFAAAVICTYDVPLSESAAAVAATASDRNTCFKSAPNRDVLTHYNILEASNDSGVTMHGPHAKSSERGRELWQICASFMPCHAACIWMIHKHNKVRHRLDYDVPASQQTSGQKKKIQY